MVPALPGVKMMPANDLEGCRQPALVTERRSRCQDAQCLFHLVVATTGKPCPQVGSLHGSRATAAEHQETEFCQPFAENDYLTVHPIGARQGMAAHHTHYLQVVVCFHEISQGVFDALVVKHARRGPRGLTESVPVGYLSFCMSIVFPGSAINGHARENLLIWIIVEIEQETAVTSHQYAIDKSTLVTISVVVSGNHEYRRS